MRVTFMLMPVAIFSTFADVRLVRHVSAERLHTVIYVLMILVGGKFIYDAVRASFNSPAAPMP